MNPVLANGHRLKRTPSKASVSAREFNLKAYAAINRRLIVKKNAQPRQPVSSVDAAVLQDNLEAKAPKRPLTERSVTD